MASNQQNKLREAHSLEKKVLLHNDIDAVVELGALLLFDQDFVSQRARGFQMLERAIKQAQDPVAMFGVAVHLLNNGDDKDHCRAVSLLESSLKLREDHFVVYRLALCYVHGEGVEQCHSVAINLFQRALRLKQDPLVMYNLALTMLKVPNLLSQKKQAISLFNKAIGLHPDAIMMNQLGMLYHCGNGNLSRCPKRASKWYRRAIRTSRLPESMRNLAVLHLDNNPGAEDIHRAVRLLEDALEQYQGQDEETMLKLAELYSVHDIDFERAVQLYETAAVRFNSKTAKCVLYGSWVDGVGDIHLDHSHIYDYCREDMKKNKDIASFLVLVSMTWSGTREFRMNRKRAVEVYYASVSNKTKHSLFSLMLRHDFNHIRGGERCARRFMTKFNDNIDKSNLLGEESVVLSESCYESDKLLALESFRAQIAWKDSFHLIAWLAPYLRIGRCNLPFDGSLGCITDTIRRFTRWKYIASLNLACLLLEIEGRQQEAVKVLEDMMNGDLRLIAMLNLAYIFMNDDCGVTKDWARGMQLLEDSVKETNDVSARAMLANALTEKSESTGSDVERGWKLWRSVEDEEDEEELSKLRRLISVRTDEKWSALALQQTEEESVEKPLKAKEEEFSSN